MEKFIIAGIVIITILFLAFIFIIMRKHQKEKQKKGEAIEPNSLRERQRMKAKLWYFKKVPDKKKF